MQSQIELFVKFIFGQLRQYCLGIETISPFLSVSPQMFVGAKFKLARRTTTKSDADLAKLDAYRRRT